MSEQNLSAVGPQREPKQDREALGERWKWVEHSMWTDPMLRTLETGIKGEKWFALIDKVYRRAEPAKRLTKSGVMGEALESMGKVSSSSKPKKSDNSKN